MKRQPFLQMFVLDVLGRDLGIRRPWKQLRIRRGDLWNRALLREDSAGS